jgi:pilus assembly protein CpaC
MNIVAQSKSQSKLLKEKIMKPGLFAASLLAAALTLTTALPLANQARAADQDISMTDDGDQSHFVRIGLNKSAVIRLPADAREVIVGNPMIVDAVVRTKNTAFLFAKSAGQTNIFFFDAQGQEILHLDLEVALDTTAIKKLLNRALPGNRITVDTANSSIVLGGLAANPLEAKTAVDLATQFVGASGASAGAASNGTTAASSAASSISPIINTMQIAGEDQVMMKVKVVEIQRDVTKQFGINFTALLDAGKFAFNLSSVAPFAGNYLGGTSDGYKGVYQSGSNKVEGLLRAMEGDGLARTLAEPNLTALTGQAAKFHAGGEFAAGRTCSSGGSGGIVNCQVTFKQYGISLGFTPTVLSEQRINLKIDTEISELASALSDGLPTLNSRSANTMLELPNGGTMMLAGLISETTRHNINGTPGLKNLPILGSLFRSRDFINNETELVIFVTPYIVRPTSDAQMSSPDKNFRPASDAQAILFGHLNKVYGSGEAVPAGEYNGNVGFIVQ